MKTDEKFMKIAIGEAIKGNKKGKYPIGAVVVKDNKVIAKSCNGLPNNLDPTAHAEMIAIRDAAKKLKSRYLNDYILYTTNEPCVMCVGAAVWANMKGIVFGAKVKDLEDFWKKRRNPKTTRKFIHISSKDILKNCRPKMHVKGNFMREKCLKLFDLYETYPYYRIKKEIMSHPLFDKFYFYLHGTITTNFKNAVDIDMKLVPREKITINQLESMMEFLVNIGVDVVFMREVNTYVPKYKPSMKDIRENDKPILQAKINVDIDELNNRKRDLKQFLYNQNIRYRKIGKLCFYISPEWAVEGYVFNRKWFYKEFKNSNVDYKRILWSGNVDIREDPLDEI